MTVGEIINRVKWCIDHETREDAKLADGGEDTYMDNMIRAKINDAMVWVATVAAQSAAMGVASIATSGNTETSLTVERYNGTSNMDVGIVTVPKALSVAGVNRVRLGGWHKAVKPIDDTEDDATMMFDENVKGTSDRPMAVIMRGEPIRLLVQPYGTGTKVEVTYVAVKTDVDTSDDNNIVDVPKMLESAMVYYIAYLLLVAYGDQRAENMLRVATQGLQTK